MKALVTGAAGFIGSHLVEQLVDEEWETACLVRKEDDIRWLKGEDIDIIYGDCTDKRSIYPALDSSPDFIFHLAGVTRSHLQTDYRTINYEGTRNVVEACLDSGIELKRFVFASSVAVIGPSASNQPICESDECRPVNEYGRSKLDAENLLRENQQRIPFTILRLGVVYGPRDRLGLYPIFKLASKGIKLVSGDMETNPIYVKDVVRCLMRAATRQEALHQTYLLGGDEVFSMSRGFDIISESMGVRVRKIKVPVPFLYILGWVLQTYAELMHKRPILDIRRLGDLLHRRWQVDSSRFKRELNVSLQYGMRAGIEETADWYKKMGWI